MKYSKTREVFFIVGLAFLGQNFRISVKIRDFFLAFSRWTIHSLGLNLSPLPYSLHFNNDVSIEERNVWDVITTQIQQP